ncbi:MAG: SLC13 family permease [Desulfurococcaceae archaeon]
MMANYQSIIGFGVLLYLIIALIMRSKKPHIPIWSIMAFSAFIVTITGLVSIEEISYLEDLNIILYLIGMFSIVSLAEQSGLLTSLAYLFMSFIRSRHALIYASSLMFGLMSAFATNDAVALMGPPIAYTLAKATGINLTPMFLLLAFSLTIGSTMTPIGNPQNVLIATRSGMRSPFIFFVARLAVPTIINLLLTARFIIWFFKIPEEKAFISTKSSEAIRNKNDAMLAAIGLLTTIVALVVNDILDLLNLPHITHRGFIPFIIAASIYMFASNPRTVLAAVDWGTIVLFMSMFITMNGVWRSGAIQPALIAIQPYKSSPPISTLSISLTAILLSQALSNVPLTNLYINYMKSIGYSWKDTADWLTLACSSTIAGNLTLLGAASNIIVLEVLESKYNTTLTFKEFTKVGVLVTIINMAVYMPFLLF